MSNSSLTRNSSTNKSQDFDEHEWVIQVRQTLEEEGDGNDIAVSIYSVPTTLKLTNPVAYMPQQVALGPYHHWREEVYEMERYKIAAARRIMKNIKCFNTFQEIVDQLHMLEPRIRACYHKYLNISSETLTWMMIIDVSFLLEFLEIYAIKEGMLLSRAKPRITSHMFNSAGRKSAHLEILRDILMLENQIPLFLPRKMLEFELGSLDVADAALLLMLKGLSKELYPFKIPEELPKNLIEDSAHVLDLFYRLLMPKDFLTFQVTEVEKSSEGNEKDEKTILNEASNNRFMKFLNAKLNINPVRFLKSVMNFKPIKLLLTPLNLITKIPLLNMLKGPISNIFKQQDKDDVKPDTDSSPLVEELAIPSVTELHEAGIFFIPTNGGICSMNFNVKTRTLSLPKVNLDVNTGTIMRNMVAYETCHASGPLIFTRYTEFMNGIIDTKDDVKLLRQRRIILNRLTSDEEAANLWNGMNRSVKLTKVPLLDKMIADVNKYYNGRCKVKAERCIKSYIYSSWRILTVLASVMIVCLLALQTLCSVYSCSGVVSQAANATTTAQP